MNNIVNWFYSLAVLMVVVWAIAFFGFHNYGPVHLFLILALVAGLYGRIIHRKNYDQ